MYFCNEKYRLWTFNTSLNNVAHSQWNYRYVWPGFNIQRLLSAFCWSLGCQLAFLLLNKFNWALSVNGNWSVKHDNPWCDNLDGFHVIAVWVRALKCKHWLPQYRFLPARRYVSTGLCESNVSVCPSVTRPYCIKTISSPSVRPTILVFWCQISSQYSKGLPRVGASNKGGVVKFSHFLALSINISKTVADRAKVTIKD